MTEVASLARELAYALDPVRWAEERLGIILDPWQRRVLSTSKKQVALNCSRQSGKSQVAAIAAAHVAIYKPGALVLLVARAKRQADELGLKAAQILRQVGVQLEGDSLSSSRLANGSRIIALPGDNPGGIRSYSAVSLLAVDEAGFVPDETYTAVAPMLAVSRGRRFLMSTPNGRQGFFYDAWTNGGDDWHREKVTAWEVPRIEKAWLESEKRSRGAWIFSQEFECEFLTTDTQLFSHDLIASLFVPDVRPWTGMRIFI